MTDAGWAEKAVEDLEFIVHGKPVCESKDVLMALKSEHDRAVRIVSRYLKRYGTEGSPCELICNDLLTALQRGRGGKG